MKRWGREALAVARLDFAEVLRSRWMVFCGGVYGLLCAVFVLVGMRESRLLGFTGLGRVLLSLSHALVLLLPLLALTATAQVVNRAREDGTLELLFSHPVRRSTFFFAITAVRYAVLAAPLVALMLLMGLFGALFFGQDVPWGFLFRALLLSSSLLAAFAGIGMAISTFVRNQARAAIGMLLAWAATVVLVDFGLIGLLLQWQLNPRTVFLLASLNPVQAVRMALLSGVSSELSVLGPVGFFLANRVGDGALLALGLVWPLAVGAGAWAVALQKFRRADLV